MKVLINFKYAFVLVAIVLLCCGCEKNIVTITYPAHLKITNLDTREVAENWSSITLGGPEYHLVASRGEMLEIEFIPTTLSIDDEVIVAEGVKYIVDFELFDIMKTISQEPYKFQHTIANDVPDGIYPIRCSALGENWSSKSSHTQIINIKVQ